MTRARAAALLATSALGLTLMSACGSISSFNSAPAGTQPSADAGGALSLVAKKVDNLGTVVTDSKGMTLYRFDKDTAQPSASNCDGPCAGTWPPVTTTADHVQINGVDKSLIGTIARKDGSVQLTLGGWPLYRYAKDAAPGDAKGQGVGNTWFASTPQGKKAAATVDAPADNSGSGY
jgi:predicted lipoprotein with Yx(FWY)xxD motif